MGLLIQLDGRVSLLCFTVVSFSFEHRVDVLEGAGVHLWGTLVGLP